MAQVLPSDIPIYNVVELDLKAPAATQGLEAAEYILTVAIPDSSTPTQWQDWLDTIKQKVRFGTSKQQSQVKLI